MAKEIIFNDDIKKTPTEVEVKQEPKEVLKKDNTKKPNKSKKIKDDIKKLHAELRKKGIPVASNKEPTIISTGIKAFDIMLGGGYAMPGISEVAGWESAGKTSFALHGIAEAQRNNLKCVFIDFERTLTEDRMSDFGVDPDKLLKITPAHIEDAFESIRTLLENGYNYFVWDSIGASLPAGDIQGDMGAERMMRRGRVNSIGFNQLIPLIDDAGAFLMLINQYYATPDQYNPKATKGGGTIAYVCKQRIELTRKTTEKSQIKNINGQPIGQEVMIKISKLKVLGGAPQSKHGIVLLYNGQYNDFVAFADLANKHGIITKEGLTYFYKGEKIGMKSKVIQFIKENRDMLYESMKAKIKLNAEEVRNKKNISMVADIDFDINF